LSTDSPDPSQPPGSGAAKPLKPWRSQGEPIVRFRTDDGKVYGSPSHSLATIFDEMSRVLAVECYHGIILITGPGTEELENALCAGQATMIRTDGKQITSVMLLVEEEGDVEAIDLGVN
jgi:hypothetical protein